MRIRGLRLVQRYETRRANGGRQPGAVPKCGDGDTLTGRIAKIAMRKHRWPAKFTTIVPIFAHDLSIATRRWWPTRQTFNFGQIWLFFLYEKVR